MDVDVQGRSRRTIPWRSRRNLTQVVVPHIPFQPRPPVQEGIEVTEVQPHVQQMDQARSMSPERVPMTSPASGVRPIEVSMLTPPRTGTGRAPLPRCKVIVLVPATGDRGRLRPRD